MANHQQASMTLPYWLLFAAAQEDAFAHKNLPSYSKLK
jgi:hypothetical protein